MDRTEVDQVRFEHGNNTNMVVTSSFRYSWQNWLKLALIRKSCSNSWCCASCLLGHSRPYSWLLLPVLLSRSDWAITLVSHVYAPLPEITKWLQNVPWIILYLRNTKHYNHLSYISFKTVSLCKCTSGRDSKVVWHIPGSQFVKALSAPPSHS